MALIQISFVFYLGCFGYIGLTGGDKNILSKMYLFACFMNIFQFLMIFLVAHDGLHGNIGNNGFARTFRTQTTVGRFDNGAGIKYCSALNPLMGIAIVLYVLIVWSEIVKESILKKYSNILFWSYQITSLISLCVWRFKSPYYNEGWYAIGYGYGAAYIKYYGETAFAK